MTTLKKVLKEHNRLCKNAYNMVEKKGADYNRKQQKDGDTLYNLSVAKQLDIVDSVTKSILVRISDKMMRLVSLTGDPKVNPEVKDEKVSDTIEDTINYLVYLYCKYQEERK
jgi:hypothetical protein